MTFLNNNVTINNETQNLSVGEDIPVVEASGKLVNCYDTLDKINNDSEVVVKGTIIENEYVDYHDLTFTISKFKIDEVVKGDVSVGDTIKVLQTGGISEFKRNEEDIKSETEENQNESKENTENNKDTENNEGAENKEDTEDKIENQTKEGEKEKTENTKQTTKQEDKKQTEKDMGCPFTHLILTMLRWVNGQPMFFFVCLFCFFFCFFFSFFFGG